MTNVQFMLRYARQRKGLSQREAAQQSGVNVKSISSFESGERIESLKVTQLQKLLRAYAMTEREFFERGERI